MTGRRADAVGTPIVTDEDGVRLITLNRPEVLNALRSTDLRSITDAVRGVGPGIDAIVLTGTGNRAFCAGMHVDTFADARPGDGRQIITQVAECIGAIRLAPIPTVAMINGYCLGAAFEMALACDVRVAHPGVHFGLPEVKLGIPSVVEAALLPHYVGWSMAKEMILTGDLYPVDDLAPFGIVNRTVPAEELRGAVDDLLTRLTAPTRTVIAAQKRLFETWLNTGLQAGIDASIDVFAEVFGAAETTEAITTYRRRTGP